jgi:hypothetical protein
VYISVIPTTQEEEVEGWRSEASPARIKILYVKKN